MSIARLRQISTAISERHKLNSFVRRKEISWQTASICFYIAQGYETGGKENLALKAAAELDMEPKPKEKEVVAEYSGPTPNFKPKIVRIDSMDLDDEDVFAIFEANMNEPDPRPGSFENMANMFGGRIKEPIDEGFDLSKKSSPDIP